MERYSVKKNKRYIKTHLSTHGYPTINLNRKHHSLHRLLAIHYIENPDNLPCVDHIDRDRTNNKLNNLRWVTHSENNQNTPTQKDNKLGIKNISWAKSNNDYVYQKRYRGTRHIKHFNTLDEAIAYKKSYEAKLIL